MIIYKEYKDITLREIELMCHALGFERKRVKYNKHKAFRNYFAVTPGQQEKEWHQLITKGLATSTEVTDNRGMIYQISFRVTKKGMVLLGNIFECKFTEME